MTTTAALSPDDRHVIALQVSKSPSGRFFIRSPDIAGMLVSGNDINEAMLDVEPAVAALAAAGCAQAQWVLARANAPAAPAYITGDPGDEDQPRANRQASASA